MCLQDGEDTEDEDDNWMLLYCVFKHGQYCRLLEDIRTPHLSVNQPRGNEHRTLYSPVEGDCSFESHFGFCMDWACVCVAPVLDNLLSHMTR